METLAPVELDLETLRRVVEQEGGCLAWGGTVRLIPADDTFVRIERELDVDTEGQLVASVLSKKIAAGSTHVVMDIPMGPTAKVRTANAARALRSRIEAVAARFGLAVRCLLTDGSQPVGHGVGPALEALDVLAVLHNAAEAPDDLRQRAALLAGAALEIGGRAAPGEGQALALKTLASGQAWRKFQAICEAQGGLRVPPVADHISPIRARCAGRLEAIDNRKLARLAKLAGAPDAKTAGVRLRVRLDDIVATGDILLEVHAETPGELGYALAYAQSADDMFDIRP